MASKKSEGPFVILGSQSIVDFNALGDGTTLNYVSYFKTRSGLEKYLEGQKTTTKPIYVFEGIQKVEFEHTLKFGPINGK